MCDIRVKSAIVYSGRNYTIEFKFLEQANKEVSDYSNGDIYVITETPRN